jgi:STE24 endopeptidase
MDGSRRSSHSNAFFSGLGPTRRIVLFDTLVQGMTTAEIVAVVAHELGHNIRKHVSKRLALSVAMTFLAFYVADVALRSPLFFEAFFVQTPSTHVGFVLFFLFAPVFTFPLIPLFSALSRKHEYEADAFAKLMTGQWESMASALTKLAKENLSNLWPHPWYSFFHYSHPSVNERITALKRDAESALVKPAKA